MTDFSNRINALSPEKRRLLEALMQREEQSERRSTESYIEPRTPAERILASIWEEVLGIQQPGRIGVNDNFFELGGDSIQSIQIAAKARQAGLSITTQQLFEQPTVARLAAISQSGGQVTAGQEAVVGPVELTPIQRWFFDLDLPQPSHWNQALLLEISRPIPPDLLERSLQSLVEHHDALRLRFAVAPQSRRQHCSPPAPVAFSRYDLSHLSGDLLSARIDEITRETQSSLDLDEGPLFRAALFDTGQSRPQQLLIVAHHLTVDGVSFRILLEDLQRSCEQLTYGGSVRLPLKTTSFQEWARRWAELGPSAQLREEAAFWLSLESAPACVIPQDFNSDDNSEESAETIIELLSEEETGVLLRGAPVNYGVRMNEVLLASLAIVICRWGGRGNLLLDVEGHGREESFGLNIDLSRTVGWMTALFPLQLELKMSSTLAQLAPDVKRQLRCAPNGGIGYGLLRYCGGDVELMNRLANIPRREVMFNYLGQFDQTMSEASWFRPIAEFCQPLYGSRNPRPHKLQVYGGVVGRRLRLYWTYSRNLHYQETISGLAGAMMGELRGLIEPLRASGGASGATTDFPDAELTPDDLQKIISAHS
ncbi:MAG TPA: condensation domain-containing protein [Blastocatellia bacterium]